MAIAAIVLQTDPAYLEDAQDILKGMPELIESRAVPPNRIAATLETPADKLFDVLQQIQILPAVHNLELVYVNYADDLENSGQIPCPPLSTLHRKLSKES